MVAYSFKPRFVPMIRLGLGLPANYGAVFEQAVEFGDIIPKRQTIRAIGKRRHVRPGEIIQLYTGMRTKQCRKIGEAKCTGVTPIALGVFKSKLEIMRHAPDPISLNAFARADGFVDFAEMHQFWLKEHGTGKFDGVLIKWEPLP